MLWNYHDDDTTGAPEKVAVQVKNITAKNVTLTQYRIDDRHSNSYEVWKKMGSPKAPTAAQITTLEKAGLLAQMTKPVKASVKNGMLSYSLAMPRQAVALLKIEW